MGHMFFSSSDTEKILVELRESFRSIDDLADGPTTVFYSVDGEQMRLSVSVFGGKIRIARILPEECGTEPWGAPLKETLFECPVAAFYSCEE